jgi:hypothetical protein
LGPDARNWLDGGTGESEPIIRETAKYSAPSIRKDLPSQTEHTDLTSIGSLAYSQDALDTESLKYVVTPEPK